MDKQELRARVRAMAAEAEASGDACAWFEALYAEAGGDAASIPWADGEPNPNFMSWPSADALAQGTLSLVVGCGLGDDAEELAHRGLSVTAFDLSPSAIEACRRIYPGSSVRYEAQDLFRLPDAYHEQFEFVLEIYTLQAMPLSIRAGAFAALARCLAPGGRLLVIARLRDDDVIPDQLPWPLSRAELRAFEEAGLQLECLEDFMDDEDVPQRRVRACYRRPSDGSLAQAGGSSPD
jgi:SAM-dependent methyltransferase